MICFVPEELISVRSTAGSNSCCDQAQICNAVNIIFFERIKSEVFNKLENTNRRRFHISPNLLVIEVHLPGVWVRNVSQLTGLINNRHCIKTKDIVLCQTDCMRRFHVKTQNRQTVFILEDTIPFIEVDWSDDNAGRMVRQRYNCPLQSIEIVEDIRMVCTALFSADIVFLFHFCDSIKGIRILGFIYIRVFSLPDFSKGSSNLIDCRLPCQSTHSQNVCTFLAAERFKDVVVNHGTISIRHIDINITNLNTVFITEAREHQIPASRVNIDNVGNECTPGTCNGTTTWSERNALIFAPNHQVAHRKHKAQHIGFLKDCKLLFNICLKLCDFIFRNDAATNFVVQHIMGTFDINHGI